MFLWNIAVTSLAEVWIEILPVARSSSLVTVTSLAEVWIEIVCLYLPVLTFHRHFPCGSVD